MPIIVGQSIRPHHWYLLRVVAELLLSPEPLINALRHNVVLELLEAHRPGLFETLGFVITRCRCALYIAAATTAVIGEPFRPV
jgi:hypothetical protein